jgi:hypothetical protein
MNKNLNIKEILELLRIYKNYILELNNFEKKYNFKMRKPNFPEGLSENIIKEYINIVEKRKCININGGDLLIKNSNLKIEVKCFSSNGPTSFGPKENWNELYFLDAIQFMENNFKIYKINLSNTDEKFKNIKINENKTYNDICIEGKRPRIVFNKLKKLLDNNIENIYNGDLFFYN